MCFWSYPQSVHLLFLPFDRIVESLGMSLSAVAAKLATLSFQCMLPAIIFTLTGSLLLLSALWNPEAAKQIVKWRVSTFRQRSNPDIFFLVHRLHATCWVEYKPG